jgi:putative CocE/NonD family hydrolase
MHGYVAVIQDVRGRYASEGAYRMMQDDSWGQNQDGIDTILWLGRQPWSSGRVGTFGVSYGGAIQMLVAPARPPYLTACFSEQPASDEFTQRSLHDGALCLEDVQRWAAGNADDIIARMPEAQRQRALDEARQYQELGAGVRKQLPLREVPLLRLIPALWQDVLDHWEDRSFFDANDATSRLQDVAVPITHVGGWFDFFLRNTINHFIGCSSPVENPLAAGARANQHLIIGPWTHGGMTRGEAGETAFPEAAFDDFGAGLAWHDRWLRGVELPGALQAKVLLYVMGENRWRVEDAWPLPGTAMTDYFLRAGGLLAPEAPGAESADTFEYDPRNPLPSCGGNGPGFAGRNDFSQHLQRPDVLVYTTPPLSQPLEVTGNVRATIYAASSATDTDWTAKLLDVTPDGKSYHVAGGILRARYRRSRTAPEPLTPGAVEPFDLDMWATSLVFRPGHRIRLVISSSDFPVHDRNPNAFVDLTRHTERDFVVANQTVHHSAQYPSAVHLPVIPAARERRWVSNPLPFNGPAAPPEPAEAPASALPS